MKDQKTATPMLPTVLIQQEGPVHEYARKLQEAGFTV